MNIQCTCCGGTDVTCEARINPNTNQFIDFTEDSFLEGQCEKCGEVILTDAQQLKSEIQKKYDQFILEKGRKPDYLQCEVVYTDEGKVQANVLIRINQVVDKEIDEQFMFNCDNLEELISYCDPCKEFFVITVAFHFGHSEMLKQNLKRIV